MTTFIRSAIFAVAVLGGLAAAQARDLEDTSRAASSYDLNSPNDVKAFWEQQDRNNGN
jgi:hypothetical protein